MNDSTTYAEAVKPSVEPSPGKIELYLDSLDQRLDVLTRELSGLYGELIPILADSDKGTAAKEPESDANLSAVARRISGMDDHVLRLVHEVSHIRGRVQL